MFILLSVGPYMSIYCWIGISIQQKIPPQKSHSSMIFPPIIHISITSALVFPSFFFLGLFQGLFPSFFHGMAPQVHQEAAQPLLRSALQGQRSTLIFFGQTGTGKTYTARGVLEAEVVKQPTNIGIAMAGFDRENTSERKSGIIVGMIILTILVGFHVGNRNDNTLS